MAAQSPDVYSWQVCAFSKGPNRTQLHLPPPRDTSSPQSKEQQDLYLYAAFTHDFDEVMPEIH